MSVNAVETEKKIARKGLWNTETPFREVVAFCPNCKGMETLTYTRGGIVPTKKYTQKDGLVYHTCGSDVPCRLYSLS